MRRASEGEVQKGQSQKARARVRASGVILVAISAIAVIDAALADSASGLGPIHRLFPDLGSTGLARGGLFEVIWALSALAYIVVLWRPRRGERARITASRVLGRLIFTALVVVFFAGLFYMMAYSAGMSRR